MMIKMPDKSKDIIEEAFRLGWESALTLHDMIDKQSEQCAIDNLRGIAYALYFDALHEKCVKEAAKEVCDPEPSKEIKIAVVDRYPCHDCWQDPTWCCGCEEERMWKEKHKK
jgi:hypothetical protein